MAILHSNRARAGRGVVGGFLHTAGGWPDQKTGNWKVRIPTDARSLCGRESLCPCDRCPHAAMCGDLRLACRAFSRFVRGIQWKNTVRRPTHKRYLQLFASENSGAPPC